MSWEALDDEREIRLKFTDRAFVGSSWDSLSAQRSVNDTEWDRGRRESLRRGSSSGTHQQVLRLYVPVDDVQAVQVLDGAGQVEEHTAGVPLGVLVGGSDGVKEVPSLEKAEHAKVRWTATDFRGPKIKKICIK